MTMGVHKKETGFAIAIVVAIVLIGSLLLFLIPSPEEVVGVSQDGLVHVEGVSRDVNGINIERIDDAQMSVSELVSPMYEIVFLSNSILKDAEITFLFEEYATEDFVIQNAVVYQFDRSVLAWKALPTLFDLNDKSISALIDVSGSTLVGIGVRVQGE